VKFTLGKVLALAAIAAASAAQAQQDRPVPKSWSYDVDQRGHRVARTTRLTRPDGSWREETRQGNCVAIKERSAAGEYRESRQCNPAPPAKPQ
jgi:hypothetical protein